MLSVMAIALAGLGLRYQELCEEPDGSADRSDQSAERQDRREQSRHPRHRRPRQAGITKAQGAADSATQNAQGAQKAAGDAENAANDAVHRADSLASVVAGLDNYQAIGNVSVTFGFDKSVLTKDDKDQLDTFAATLLPTPRATSLKSPAAPTRPATPTTTTLSASAAPTLSCSTWRPSTRFPRTAST
jgi:outer membrane protein OmpA-like peptidoglycan-associated protein